MTALVTFHPRWYDVAKSYIGVQEVVGAGSDPRILRWVKRMGGWIASWYTNDDTPWCAVFMNQCFFEAGIQAPYSLAARSYETWGVALEEPTLGAVVVFKRAGGGHVGLYVGERADGTLRVLGGNQSNKVSETWIGKDRLVAIRWPSMEPISHTGRVRLSGDGLPVSTNEA